MSRTVTLPCADTAMIMRPAGRGDAVGIAGSIGSVGDALDNALMESTIGLFKTELIDRQRSWTSRAQVRAAAKS